MSKTKAEKPGVDLWQEGHWHAWQERTLAVVLTPERQAAVPTLPARP